MDICKGWLGMNTVRISSFVELHEVIKSHLLPSYWLFRGQSDANWEILPKAKRLPFSRRSDVQLFNNWKRQAIEYIQIPPSNEWHWLALAQHHGLATRLIDWSSNPLVAAFFACNNNELDGAIYAYLGGKFVLESSFNSSLPWDVTEPVIFHPFIKSRRVSNQSASFTISEEPEVCFSKQIQDDDKLVKIIIDKSCKAELLFELSLYGINSKHIYPDLDGLSQFANWQVEYGSEYMK